MQKISLFLLAFGFVNAAHAQDLSKDLDKSASKINKITLTLPFGVGDSNAIGDPAVMEFTRVSYHLDLYDGAFKTVAQKFHFMTNFNHCKITIYTVPPAGSTHFDNTYSKEILSDNNELTFSYSKEDLKNYSQKSITWKLTDTTNAPAAFKIASGSLTCFTSDEIQTKHQKFTVGNMKQQLTGSPNDMSGRYLKIERLE